MKIRSIQALGAFGRPGDKFPDDLPQVAFAGRSNVGKSSLLNRMVGRHKLAPTSSTPGKTRRIHFFMVNKAFYLVDLPGYGYARLPQSVKRSWRGIIENYLESSRRLCGVVSLIDIRRLLGELDRQLLLYLAERNIPTVIALTKADKLPRGRRIRMVQSLLSEFEGKLSPDQVVVTSARTGEGCKELLKAVGALITAVSV